MSVFHSSSPGHRVLQHPRIFHLLLSPAEAAFPPTPLTPDSFLSLSPVFCYIDCLSFHIHWKGFWATSRPRWTPCKRQVFIPQAPSRSAMLLYPRRFTRQPRVLLKAWSSRESRSLWSDFPSFKPRENGWDSHQSVPQVASLSLSVVSRRVWISGLHRTTTNLTGGAAFANLCPASRGSANANDQQVSSSGEGGLLAPTLRLMPQLERAFYSAGRSKWFRIPNLWCAFSFNLNWHSLGSQDRVENWSTSHGIKDTRPSIYNWVLFFFNYDLWN